MAETATRIITVTPHAGTVRVRFAGETIAETSKALALDEPGYPRVLYIPRADVRFDRLERSKHVTQCPYKGEASYFHIVAGGKRAENAVWSYELPFANVAAIRGHVAFYPDRVDAIDG